MLRSESKAESTTIGVETQAESALRAVRIVLGVLAAFVVALYRPLAAPSSWTSTLSTIGGIFLAVAILNMVSSTLQRTPLRLAIAQLYDIFAIVGLASVLDGPLGEQTWALLLIPIVSASVRMGVAAALVTWAAGCVTYQVAAWTGFVSGLDETGLLLQAPGTLLAIAITVGLLARWMREGWEIQNELTEQSRKREERLAVLETTSRQLTNQTIDGSLDLCASQTLALGFDAVTAHFPDEEIPRIALGSCELVAGSVTDLDHGADVLVTAWTEDDAIRVNSASRVEPNSGATFTAWSTTPMEPDQVQAFATLVAHTSTSVSMASIRERLEIAASRDPLTGLANRRTFDTELVTAAAGPGAVAIAFIDVNDFKSLNDQHGHLVGDKVLVAISQRIETAVAERGLVARFGGDEFVVLLSDCVIEEAALIGQAISDAMVDPVVVGSLSLPVALSVGVAGGETPLPPLDLVRASDQAAYQAKSQHKARKHRNERAEAQRQVAAETVVEPPTGTGPAPEVTVADERTTDAFDPKALQARLDAVQEPTPHLLEVRNLHAQLDLVPASGPEDAHLVQLNHLPACPASETQDANTQASLAPLSAAPLSAAPLSAAPPVTEPVVPLSAAPLVTEPAAPPVTEPVVPAEATVLNGPLEAILAAGERRAEQHRVEAELLHARHQRALRAELEQLRNDYQATSVD